jgi:hypothetical protein
VSVRDDSRFLVREIAAPSIAGDAETTPEDSDWDTVLERLARVDRGLDAFVGDPVIVTTASSSFDGEAPEQDGKMTLGFEDATEAISTRGVPDGVWSDRAELQARFDREASISPDRSPVPMDEARTQSYRSPEETARENPSDGVSPTEKIANLAELMTSSLTRTRTESFGERHDLDEEKAIALVRSFYGALRARRQRTLQAESRSASGLLKKKPAPRFEPTMEPPASGRTNKQSVAALRRVLESL